MIGYRNSFLPEINGAIDKDYNGTKINVKMRGRKNINRYLSDYNRFENRLQKVTEGFVQHSMITESLLRGSNILDTLSSNFKKNENNNISNICR